MVQLPKRLRLMRWLAGPFILLALGIGFISGGLSLTVVALFVSALPGMYSVEIPHGAGPGRYWLRAGPLLLSSLAISLILWSRYASLPTWLVIAGAVYAVLGLPAAAFDLALAFKPQLRQQLHERRLRRDSSTKIT